MGGCAPAEMPEDQDFPNGDAQERDASSEGEQRGTLGSDARARSS